MNGASAAPAWLDLAQGVTGLLLVLFMWAHMIFVSSILLGEDAMYFVARLFEGEPIFGRPYPGIVSFVVLAVLVLFLVHALAAIRKIPASWRQWRAFRTHSASFGHGDTALWLLQVVTGFVLMFLAVAHLYQMMLNPADIGPWASSERVWSGRWWPLYLVLLFAVELHAGVGIYRLAVKWGWFADERGRTPRRTLQRVKWALTVFFLALGLATLAAYMKIGYEQRDRPGERYAPQAYGTLPADVRALPQAGRNVPDRTEAA
ncbi:MAG: fumarate reductase cytochrome b subunit [Gammaproteobacteria bacterium]